jgi:hypothetical protein
MGYTENVQDHTQVERRVHETKLTSMKRYLQESHQK